MWHLVQQDPGELVSLGTYEDYEKAKLVLTRPRDCEC